MESVRYPSSALFTEIFVCIIYGYKFRRNFYHTCTREGGRFPAVTPPGFFSHRKVKCVVTSFKRYPAVACMVTIHSSSSVKSMRLPDRPGRRMKDKSGNGLFCRCIRKSGFYVFPETQEVCCKDIKPYDHTCRITRAHFSGYTFDNFIYHNNCGCNAQ